MPRTRTRGRGIFWSQALSRGSDAGKVQGKPGPAIEPGGIEREARAFQHLANHGHGVFVAVLGVDAFTVGELDAQIEQTNIHKLWTQALQIDFHSRLLRIPNCDVAEEVEVEVRAQFVVQPDED